MPARTKALHDAFPRTSHVKDIGGHVEKTAIGLHAGKLERGGGVIAFGDVFSEVDAAADGVDSERRARTWRKFGCLQWKLLSWLVS